MDKKSIGIATLTLVVVLGVAIYLGSGITGAIEKVANAVVSAVSLTLGGGTRYINGLSTDSTSPSAGQVRTTSLTVTAASTLTGTTTPTQFLFPVGGALGFTATGTAITLASNTTGPKICFGETGALSLRNTGTFSPSVVVSIGHSTSSVTTTNLIASTTIATSTPGTSFFSTVPFAANEFIWPNDSELMAIVGDITNTEASTTNYTNLTLDARILCSEIAI